MVFLGRALVDLRQQHLTKIDRIEFANDCNSFGASLSYASSDGQSGAISSQVLSNAMIKDDTEVIIMTNRSCDNEGCGYTRPGGVAYRNSRLPCLSNLNCLFGG